MFDKMLQDFDGDTFINLLKRAYGDAVSVADNTDVDNGSVTDQAEDALRGAVNEALTALQSMLPQGMEIGDFPGWPSTRIGDFPLPSPWGPQKQTQPWTPQVPFPTQPPWPRPNTQPYVPGPKEAQEHEDFKEAMEKFFKGLTAVPEVIPEPPKPDDTVSFTALGLDGEPDPALLARLRRVVQVDKLRNETVTLEDGIGEVQLIDVMGTDNAIPEQARISYNGHQRAKSDEDNAKLLRFLMASKHFSPFSGAVVKFRFKMPLSIVQQHLRHDRFHHSQLSARYTALEEAYYVPPVWRIQSKGNKQCSEGSNDLAFKDLDPKVQQEWYLFMQRCSPIAWDVEPESASDAMTTAMNAVYVATSQAYQLLIDMGAPKEQARFVGPVGQYTEIISTANLGDWMLWMNQRLHPHAQKEIRDYAVEAHDILGQLFPEAIKAFDQYQRWAQTFSEQEMGVLLLGLESPELGLYDFLRNGDREERKQFLIDNGLTAKSERANFLKKLEIL